MRDERAAEATRLLLVARADKARRLRCADGAPVELGPPASSDGYHFFLSHVWGTGQDQMRIVKQRLVEMLPDARVFLDVDDLEEIGDLEGNLNIAGYRNHLLKPPPVTTSRNHLL